MGTTSPAPVKPMARNSSAIPPLENGAHLNASEFMRRYEAMPEVKKAELIQGIVYMASPVRAIVHGKPDSMMHWWMGIYAEATPGIETYSNSTVRFGADDVPQPDGMMCLLPSRGGKSRIDVKGYITGAPELVVEIAASSASLDMQEKLETYRRFGVPEYLLWLTEINEFLWLHLENDEYKPLPVAAGGIIRSRVFPGLWLDVKAMLAGDRSGARTALKRGLKSKEHAKFVK